MNMLETKYLGSTLPHPFVVSSSPLTRDLDGVRRLEDAGASAVVLESIFEEEIRHHGTEIHNYLVASTDAFPEAISLLPEPLPAAFGPEEHLRKVEKICSSVGIPVFASLNASSPGGWSEYASCLEDTGVAGLELNVYFVPAGPTMDGREVEKRVLDVVRAVTGSCELPVAVKVSPFFSSFRDVARRLSNAGAEGLVLFNRFYQPDIDLEALEVVPHLVLSTPWESRLALRWIAILFGKIEASLAATTGVHEAEDALKLVAAGADVTMLCSVLLREGLEKLAVLKADMESWLQEHDYPSLRALRGTMSQIHCPEPEEFERANYMKTLRTYF